MKQHLAQTVIGHRITPFGNTIAPVPKGAELFTAPAPNDRIAIRARKGRRTFEVTIVTPGQLDRELAFLTTTR